MKTKQSQYNYSKYTALAMFQKPKINYKDRYISTSKSGRLNQPYQQKPKGGWHRILIIAFILVLVSLTIFITKYLIKTCELNNSNSCLNFNIFGTLNKIKNISNGNSQIGNEENLATVAKTYDRVLFATVSKGLEKKISSDILSPNFNQDIIKNSNQEISIGWVGDMVPTTIQTEESISEKTNSYFGDFTAFFSTLDIMSGNLEGVLTDNTEYQSKCAKMSTNCFALKGSGNFAETLKGAGFDIVNIANNHSLDFGVSGLKDTQNNLDLAQIAHTGAKNKIAYFETKGTKIAYIGFAQNSNLNTMSDLNQMKKIIAEARTKADIVIATIHAGAEGSTNMSVPDDNEIYLGENRGNTKQIAHNLIDSGADMVLGSGPHVLRGIEIYNNKVIAYSLGNFLSVNKLSKNNFLGLSAILVANFDKAGITKSIRIIPAKISAPEGIPYFDESGASIVLINHLSKENFGENGLILDENGQAEIN